MNFFNRKNQKRIASVICILVIIAMVLPMVLEYLVKLFIGGVIKGAYSIRIEWTPFCFLPLLIRKLLPRSAIHRKTLTLHFPG